MVLGMRWELRLWEAMALSPGDHGSDQRDGTERRVADSAGRSGCSAGVGTAREFAPILTSTSARELASDDVLRLEGIARPVTLYGSCEMGPGSALARAFHAAPPDRIATRARVPK